MLQSLALFPVARKAWRVLRSLLLILGALLLLITFTPIDRWWAAAMTGPWGENDGQILIVLGGDLTTTEILGRTSYWRSFYTVLAWREGHYRELVISGRSLAVPMRDYVVAYGIPPQAIVLEDRSRDTHENALFTAELLRNEPGKKVLLTSDYHMFRAWRAFRKAGLDVSPLPFPEAQKRAGDPLDRWTIFCILVTETAGILYYGARGWI